MADVARYSTRPGDAPFYYALLPLPLSPPPLPAFPSVLFSSIAILSREFDPPDRGIFPARKSARSAPRREPRRGPSFHRDRIRRRRSRGSRHFNIEWYLGEPRGYQGLSENIDGRTEKRKKVLLIQRNANEWFVNPYGTI